jgi:hypothetical protein
MTHGPAAATGIIPITALANTRGATARAALGVAAALSAGCAHHCLGSAVLAGTPRVSTGAMVGPRDALPILAASVAGVGWQDALGR